MVWLPVICVCAPIKCAQLGQNMGEKDLGGRGRTRGRSRAPHHVGGRGRHPSTWTVAGATVHAGGRGRHLSTWTVAGATYHVDGRGRHPGLFCNSQMEILGLKEITLLMTKWDSNS